jgi:hypothetical protein
MKFTFEQIRNWSVAESRDGKTWKAARPMLRGYPISWRIRNAWGVLIGKYDALDWDHK